MTEPEFFALDPNTPWGRSVTHAEFSEIVKTGYLQGPCLELYWRMNEFQSPMPERLRVQVGKRGFELLLRNLVKEGLLPRSKLKEFKRKFWK